MMELATTSKKHSAIIILLKSLGITVGSFLIIAVIGGELYVLIPWGPPGGVTPLISYFIAPVFVTIFWGKYVAFASLPTLLLNIVTAISFRDRIASKKKRIILFFITSTVAMSLIAFILWRLFPPEPFFWD